MDRLTSGKDNLAMTDKEIQQAVLRELEWEPLVQSTEIGVAVKDGIVTLSGFVNSYTKKYHAEDAAKRVEGVKAVVNDLEVKLPFSDERTDEDIAKAAVQALEDRITVPHERIKLTVRDGWITLEGEVEWNYQKGAAEAAVRDLAGVKGVTNRIVVMPRVTAMDVKSKIEQALKRMVEVDAKNIKVETTDSKVILRGKVRSWAEWNEALQAAWRAPGVKQVENELVISP
jgi:osmotically-inducible protein OsmY